jgi:hypothetical protein
MPDMTLRNRVDEALQAVELQPSDVAAVALARRYADEIDRWEQHSADPEYEGGNGLKEYGPKLLQALDALGLTPKARRAATRPEGGTGGGASKRNPLDEVRAQRERRITGA